MNFGGISHVMRNPTGSYSAVGSVPVTCVRSETPPTRSQVLGGRTYTRDGVTYGWAGRAFDTPAECRAAVLAGAGRLCTCCELSRATDEGGSL